MEIPSARACSLGHIPAATSFSPSVSPPPTHFLFPLPHFPQSSHFRRREDVCWGILMLPHIHTQHLSLHRASQDCISEANHGGCGGLRSCAWSSQSSEVLG